MKKGLAAVSAVLTMAIVLTPAYAGEKIVLTGKDAWTGVRLVGYNPYGDKKSFYPAPITYADWGSIFVHSRGSEQRKGAEENTALIRFDLAKIPKDAKVAEAKFVFPLTANAGKKNAVQVFEVLVPWTDKVDWKTTDGKTAWEVEGVHGEKDRKPAAAFDVPNEKVSAKEPKEMSADLTDLVNAWVSGKSPNHGVKLEMTGGYVRFAMKGFRLEIECE